MNIESIARVCHEVNRAYCKSLGDTSQVPWDEAPAWQRESAVNGVRFHLEHLDSSPGDSHRNWLKEKLETGWLFGPVKDPITKRHPCIVPFEELPVEQQAKDHLFVAVVRALEGEP